MLQMLLNPPISIPQKKHRSTLRVLNRVRWLRMRTGRWECVISAISCVPSTAHPETSAKTGSFRCSCVSEPGWSWLSSQPDSDSINHNPIQKLFLIYIFLISITFICNFLQLHIYYNCQSNHVPHNADPVQWNPRLPLYLASNMKAYAIWYSCLMVLCVFVKIWLSLVHNSVAHKWKKLNFFKS